MHWESTLRHLGIAAPTLNAARTCILGGFFYNTSTPAPTAAELDSYINYYRTRGAEQFLVPTVRNSARTEALQARGFVKIPWFIESIYMVRDGVDTDLHAQVGHKRHRQIVRLSERAAQDYDTAYYEWPEIRADARIFDVAARLHEHNMLKYHHPLNLYGKPILRRLSESPLGRHLLFCIRRDRATGEPVQMSLSLVHEGRSQMYQLVQGIWHERVCPGNNLDITDYYDLCKFAERRGIREINFGRGMADYKRRLGANRFILLNNWLLTTSRAASGELAALVESTQRNLSMSGGAALRVGQSLVE